MDVEQRLASIEAQLQTIKERNAKVEAHKAWETSWFRVGSIVLMTYVIAAFALVSIGNDHPFRNALIPAIGFFLSTRSLPFVREWWIKAHLEK